MDASINKGVIGKVGVNGSWAKCTGEYKHSCIALAKRPIFDKVCAAASQQAKLNTLVEAKAEEMMATHLAKLKAKGPTLQPSSLGKT